VRRLVRTLIVVTVIFLNPVFAVGQDSNTTSDGSETIERQPTELSAPDESVRTDRELKNSEVVRLVAHAAGGIDGHVYTNCLEALDHNYGLGMRYFEIDLDWTTDGHLVLIHGWGATFKEWFQGAEQNKRPSLAEFKMMPMKHGMTSMTMTDLYAWLENHKDASIITDVKSSANIDGLQKISESAPDRSRFIPQIYYCNEYEPAIKLGFNRVILTLYRTDVTKDELLSFIKDHTLFAITMPMYRALEHDLATALDAEGIFVYVHTINFRHMWPNLKAHGVRGLYTDFLTFEDIRE
jgi:glycerophosphoryl diester phosphodiesterase